MKQKKPKFEHHWEQMYGINFYWFRGSRKKYEELVKKEFGRNAPRRSKWTSGTFEVYWKEKAGQHIGVLWFKDKSPGPFAHEVFHAVHWALDQAGMVLTDDSEEAYAYFIQHLTDVIMGTKKS